MQTVSANGNGDVATSSDEHRELPLRTSIKLSKPIVERPYERKAGNADQTPVKLPESVGQPEVQQHLTKVKTLSAVSPDIKGCRLLKGIGIENLPNQIYRRSIINGFNLNMMVVGSSGLGKSTFINSLFQTDLYCRDNPPPSQRVQKTVSINTSTVRLSENSVDLTLTLIDTPGFGDAVNNTDCWSPVVQHVEARYSDYMRAQSRLDRNQVIDGRVHVCLYFIEPTGHCLKPLDVEFMRQLHALVNIVPVIAKADTMMPDECTAFKATVMQQIRAAGIRIYDFPEEIAVVYLGKVKDSRLTDIVLKRNRQPFAIVSSSLMMEKSGLRIRVRQYPWGIVEVDNLEHNDFAALRTLLLSSHLQDLKDQTDQLLYENFRTERLNTIAQESKFGVTADGRDPMSQLDEQRREHEVRLRKMDADMEQLFQQKVDEKSKKLEEFETKIERTEREMQIQMEQEVKEQEYRRNQFEAERLQWEEENRESLQASRETLDVKEKGKTKTKWMLK